MEMLDTYVLTMLKLNNDGKVVSANVRVAFDNDEAEADGEADVENDCDAYRGDER